MNDDRRQNDDELDALLSQATWQEPREGAEERLANAWRGVRSRPEPHRSRFWLIATASAVAASLLLGVKLTNLMVQKPRPAVVDHHVEPPKPQLLAVATVQNPAAEVWRDPSLTERLIMLSAERRYRAARGTEKAVPLQPAAQPLAAKVDANLIVTSARTARSPDAQREIIRQLLVDSDEKSASAFLDLVMDPETRPAALAVLHPLPAGVADEFLAQLRGSLVARRMAAARALGAICDPAIETELQRMVRDDDHRREALATLLSCRDERAGQFLAALRERPADRAQLDVIQNELSTIY